VDWPANCCPVGLLSMAEIDHSIPVCDRLKSPDGKVGERVWILHGRDHFSLCFEAPGTLRKQKPTDSPAMDSLATKRAKSSTNDEDDESQSVTSFSLFHWNGLPPAGPRVTELLVTTPVSKLTGRPQEAAPAPPDSKQGVPKFRTPKPGQIWDVVQAHQGDKKDRPNQWKTWRYEVVLAVPDPDGRLYGQGESWPEGKGPPIFQQVRYLLDTRFPFDMGPTQSHSVIFSLFSLGLHGSGVSRRRWSVAVRHLLCEAARNDGFQIK